MFKIKTKWYIFYVFEDNYIIKIVLYFLNLEYIKL